MKNFENWEKKNSHKGILIFSLEEEYLEIKIKTLQLLQVFC
jgi:hypothetical protein